MRIMLIFPSLSNLSTHNIGLVYLASALTGYHTTRILSLCLDPGRKTGEDIRIKEVIDFHPDIIGFSATSFTFHSSLKIAGVIRRIAPKVRFIWGGVHPTLLPEETISHPLVDAICIGEGERALLEYLNKLEVGEEPKVDGIWYKDHGSRVIRNPLRAFEENLDNLPFPDWDYWNIEKCFSEELYYTPGSLQMLASRGCPFDCTFCSNATISNNIPGRYYRARSPDNIISEIKHNEEKYYSKGFRNIHFGDETFGLDLDLLREFCNKFRKEGLHKRLTCSCGTRADLVTPEWAGLVAGMGFKWVWMGIESGDDYIRQVIYRKAITRDNIIEATRNLKKNGINVGFQLMIGCPQENISSVIATIKLLYRTSPSNFYYSAYVPLPRTELAKSIMPQMWIKDMEFKNYWNTPRVTTYYLKSNTINIIIYLIRIFKILFFFLKGVELNGIKFILDLLRHLFITRRRVSMLSPYFLSDFERITILKYCYLKEKELHKSNSQPKLQCS